MNFIRRWLATWGIILAVLMIVLDTISDSFRLARGDLSSCVIISLIVSLLVQIPHADTV